MNGFKKKRKKRREKENPISDILGEEKQNKISYIRIRYLCLDLGWFLI